jgi:RND family efflux transporter MFP subunit
MNSKKTTPILLLCAVLATLAGCHSSSKAETQTTTSSASIRVVAAKPARKTLRRECVQPGQIEAFEVTPLFAKLPSYVQQLHVDIGDHVAADQLLAELFLPELKDELRQKDAARTQAQAEVELATAAVRAAEAAAVTARANVAAAEAGGTRAEADVTRWKSQFARITQLVAGGSLDSKLEDETRNSLKAAEAARDEARAKIDAARAAVLQSEADVAKAKANEAVARARQGSTEADFSRTKALLEYTRICAPYAGVVTARNVNRGDFVQPAGALAGKPLLTVARAEVVRIFVDVPELDSSLVEPGRKGYVNVEALPDQTVDGKVTRTSWALGANRTLHTEIDIANPDRKLRPGMYTTAHIVLQESPDALVLPVSAIVRDGAKTFCWVVRDGSAARVPIVVGLQVGNEAAVTSGLKSDDLVVQTPPASLREGQPIEVTPPPGR